MTSLIESDAQMLFSMFPIKGYDSWTIFLIFLENSTVWKKGKVHFGACTKRKDILCCVCVKEEYYRVAEVFHNKMMKLVDSGDIDADRFRIHGPTWRKQYVEKLLGKELEKIKSYGKDNKKKDKR